MIRALILGLLALGIAVRAEVHEIRGKRTDYCMCFPSEQCWTKDELNERDERVIVEYKNGDFERKIRPQCEKADQVCCRAAELQAAKDKKGEIPPAPTQVPITSPTTQGPSFEPVTYSNRKYVSQRRDLEFRDESEYQSLVTYTRNYFRRMSWAVFVDTEKTPRLCEGFLIHMTAVITVGDCVHGIIPDTLSISLQKWILPQDPSRPREATHSRKVIKTLYHPKYQYGNPSNNLVLLKIDEPFSNYYGMEYLITLPNKTDNLETRRSFTFKFNQDEEDTQEYSGVVEGIVRKPAECRAVAPTLCTYHYFDGDLYEVVQSSPIYCRVEPDNKYRYNLCGLIYASMDNDPRISFQLGVDLAKARDWIDEALSQL